MTSKKIEHEKCFYCDALISTIEYDHFPIPQSCGGKITVPSCISCHDMKDRFTYQTWSDSWKEKTLKEMLFLSRETKIFISKVITFYEFSVQGQYKNDKSL